MKRIARFLVLAAWAAWLAGCETPLTPQDEPAPAVDAGHPAYGPRAFGTAEVGLSPAARRELAAVRQATARYHDLERALADGYVDINVFAPGQGFHYLKPALLDATFELERPELLLYAPGPKGGLRLVGVEYAVPLALADTAPEGFAGAADVWHVNETFGLWTLHVWIWQGNPDGVFAESNPNVAG